MGTEVVDLVRILVWPLTILVIAIVFHKPLRDLLAGLRGSLRSMKVAGVELAFSDAAAVKTALAIDAEVRKGGNLDESSVEPLATELTARAQLQQVVIDLGNGREWITSRLYVVATLLHRMRGVQSVIFVATVDNQLETFVGQCGVEALRWRLVKHAPWLEAAMLGAEKGFWDFPAETVVASDHGRIEPATSSREPAAAILANYVSLLKQPAAGGDTQEWVALSPNTWEHARWVTRELLAEQLGIALDTQAISDDAFRASDDKAKVAAILAHRGPLVVVTSRDGSVQATLDRTRWLETLAQQRA